MKNKCPWSTKKPDGHTAPPPRHAQLGERLDSYEVTYDPITGAVYTSIEAAWPEMKSTGVDNLVGEERRFESGSLVWLLSGEEVCVRVRNRRTKPHQQSVSMNVKL